MTADTMRRKSLYGFEMREPDERRVDPAECKTHNIKQLWQRTHEILRLALLGYKATKIAEMLEITPQTVSNTINSDLGMQKLSAMRQEKDEKSLDVIAEVQRTLLPKALKVYKKILEDDEANLGLRKDTSDTVVMDILGHRAPQRVQGAFAHAHLVRSEIEEIKKRGRAAALATGKIIDVIAEENDP